MSDRSEWKLALVVEAAKKWKEPFTAYQLFGTIAKPRSMTIPSVTCLLKQVDGLTLQEQKGARRTHKYIGTWMPVEDDA